VGKGGVDAASATQNNDQNALVQLAQTSAQQSGTLFAQGQQDTGRATDYYSALASGDPQAIARAIAPAAQQADTAAASAKQNILQNGPAGGEKNLALEQVDVNRGKTVGDAASNGYSGSFQSLANLGQAATGQSQTSQGQALSGYGTAGGMALQEQGLQVQQKGNTLGAISSLAGDATQLAFL
jgi:hypothetical protein